MTDDINFMRVSKIIREEKEGFMGCKVIKLRIFKKDYEGNEREVSELKFFSTENNTIQEVNKDEEKKNV